MKNPLFLLCLNLISLFSYGQNYEIVKGIDKSRTDRLYFGVKNTSTDVLVIPTQFNYIYFIADSTFVQVDYNGKKGVFNLDGSLRIPAEYDEIISFDGYMFKVKKDSLWGLTNEKNEITTPIEYNWISRESETHRIAFKNKLFGVIDDKNNIVLTLKYKKSPTPWKEYFITIENGAYGLYNTLGQQILEPVYSNISPFMENYLLIKDFDKYCIWSPKEAENINFKYSFVSEPYKELASATIGNLSGVIDSGLNTIIPFRFEKPIDVRATKLRVDSSRYFGYYSRTGKRLTDIYYFGHSYYAHGWAVLESHRKKAAIDIGGSEHPSFQYREIYIIDREKAAVKEDEFLWTIRYLETNERVNDKTYRYISRFNNGLGFAKNKNGHCLLVNDALEELTPAKYNYIFIKDGYAEVTLNGKKGIVNKKGKEIIPARYESIFLNRGFYSCNTRNKEDVYNKAGRKIFSKSYKHIVNLPDSNFIIYSKRKWGILDSNSVEVLPFYYQQVLLYQNVYLVKTTKTSWQIINKDQSVISEHNADYLNPVDNGLIRIKNDDNFGVINIEGKQIVPAKFDRIEFNGKSFITVFIEGKKGLYSYDGKLILAPNFEIIEPYYGSFARVRKDGKWGHINLLGELIYEPKYSDVTNFNLRKATVTQNDKKTLIDETGKELLPCIYHDIYYTRSHVQLIDIKIDEKWGLLDLDLNTVVEPKYTSIGRFDRNGIALVMLEKNGKKSFGAVTNSGKEIVLPIYDKLVFDNLRIIATVNNVQYVYTLDGKCITCDE